MLWLLLEEDRNVRKKTTMVSAGIGCNRLVEIMPQTLYLKDFKTYLSMSIECTVQFSELWFIWSLLILLIHPWAYGEEDFPNFHRHSSVNTWFLQACKRNCYSLLLTVTPSIDSCNVVNSTNLLIIGRLKAMLIPYDCNNSADFWLSFGGWRAFWGYFVGW